MNQITIVGMGPGGKSYLTMQALEVLTQSNHVYLRTDRHPVVPFLKEQGMKYIAFDEVYDQAETFDQTYEIIANKIIELANETDVIYAVPGNPFVAEKTVELIIEKVQKAHLNFIHGASFIDAIITALHYDPVKGLEIVDGLNAENEIMSPKRDRLIIQVYNQTVASEVKLKLMDQYDDNHNITIINGAGIEGIEKILVVPLHKLDHHVAIFDHLTSLFVPKTQDEYFEMHDLKMIMKKLRSENGCPWDREQTHQTLAKYLVEEAYEVLSAVEHEDDAALVDELGDVLLQVVFHATIADEDGYFSLNDIIKSISEKMIRRHPHVFGDVEVANSDEVLVNWQAIKAKEKSNDRIFEAMQSIPLSTPALIRSQKVQKIASGVGFDWQNVKDAFDKIEEELQELKDEVDHNNLMLIEEEYGDLLLIVSNVGRMLGIDSEIALAKAIEKFIRRFKFIEEKLLADNEIPNRDLFDKMDNLWVEAKKWDKL